MTEADKTVAELMALADARELARKRQYECERYINTCEDTAEDRAELVRLQQARVEADRAFEQAISRAVDWELVAWATHHEPPMLWNTKDDATSYCDDDEEPIPLYARNKP